MKKKSETNFDDFLVDVWGMIRLTRDIYNRSLMLGEYSIDDCKLLLNNNEFLFFDDDIKKCVLIMSEWNLLYV